MITMDEHCFSLQQAVNPFRCIPRTFYSTEFRERSATGGLSGMFFLFVCFNMSVYNSVEYFLIHLIPNFLPVEFVL